MKDSRTKAGPPGPALAAFKRRLARVVLGSGLNFRDDLRVINVLWNKFAVERIASAEEIAPLWRGFFASAEGKGCRFCLYLNVPFCREKCSFCKFPVRIAPRPAAVERYVQDCVEEMGYFSQAASSARFGCFSVGGGTPSLLTARQMRGLLGAATRRFHVRKDALRSIEFHPVGTTPAKLAAARSADFNRVSFGVQSLDAGLLARIRRGDQTRGHVRRAVRWARRAGFDHVAVELVAGLDGDSPDAFMDSLLGLIDAEPTSVSVNVLNLTADYMKAEGIDLGLYFAGRSRTLAEICDRVRRRVPGRGYTVDGVSPTSGIWCLRRERERQGEEDGSEATDCVLGIGQPSWSHIVGSAWYERTKSDFSPDRPIYRLRRQTRELAIAGYVRDRLITASAIDFGDFKRFYGTDFRDYFELELRLLELYGKVRVDARGLRFLPVELTERFFYGSIFFLRQWTRLAAGRANLDAAFLEETRAKLL